MALTGLWPYAHVADVQRSVDFYARLGLDVQSTHEVGGRLVWAFLTSQAEPGAGLMLALADGPVEPDVQAVLFYCWAPDVAALRDKLGAGEITHPFYMPAGELRLLDPDGYVLLVGQLG
jgi:catechol 2,3-dioxygenase-like lactoylglutathione lyase family enzyme